QFQRNDKKTQPMHWSKCIVCQAETGDNACGKLQIEKQVKEIRALPSSFTEVKPLISPTNMTAPVGLSEDTQRNTMLLPSVAREEKEWLDHVSDHLTQEINKESALSWAAFHA
ncbi:hypothetical protein ElyMa_003091300, partial [Elysia marginata]